MLQYRGDGKCFGRGNWLFVGMATRFWVRPFRERDWPRRGERWSGPRKLPRDLPSFRRSPTSPRKSNVVLDLHGSVQKPDLVIFMAGNQYRVVPDLLAAFREVDQDTTAPSRHESRAGFSTQQPRPAA